MIVINQGQANTIDLTLTEKTTLSNPTYLFQFRNDNDMTYTYCIAVDSSIYTERFNRFSITEKVSPNPLNGEVYLPLQGYGHYTVYEQVSATNLNPSNTTGIVEVGKYKVIGTGITFTKYDSEPNTLKVYNG